MTIYLKSQTAKKNLFCPKITAYLYNYIKMPYFRTKFLDKSINTEFVSNQLA